MPIKEEDYLADDTIDDSPDSELSGETLPDWLSNSVSKSKRKLFGRSDSGPKPVGRRKNLTEPIQDQILFMGTLVSFIRPITGIAITDQAEDIAKALNDLAKDNPRLYAMLNKMTSGTKYGRLVGAALPVAAAAYIESFPNSGLLGTQALLIMDKGLSDQAMVKVMQFLEKREQVPRPV